MTVDRRRRLLFTPQEADVGNDPVQRKRKRNVATRPIDTPATWSRGSAVSEAHSPPQELLDVDGLPSLLYAMAMRDDGWLRFIPSGDGKALYVKWKFTRGRFAGRYCFVSGKPEQYRKLLVTLWEHIEECYDGIRKPTYDTAYNA